MPTRTREKIEAEIQRWEDRLDFAQQDLDEAQGRLSDAKDEVSSAKFDESKAADKLASLRGELEELPDESE